jgi:hypothetical protein
MDLPEITHKQREGFDHMNVLRGEWNKIDSCEFADCSIPPTVAWCGENCNFRACRFAPGEAFDSEKDLEWKAHVEDTVGDSPPTAWDQHPAIRGVVTLVEPGQPFDATHFTGVSQIPEARFEKGMVRVLVPQLRAPI